MASYNETVLWSSIQGTTGSLTLSGSPSSYTYLKVSYGSPALYRATEPTTSFNNIGAMWTVQLPTTSNYLSLFSTFYGICNTASAQNKYRAVAMYSGTKSSNWVNVFNKYGSVNSSAKDATINAAWNRIYSVVGVSTGSAGYFHKDLLYDIVRDGETVKLAAHPSGYRRIGISFNLPFNIVSATNRSMESYSEWPVELLTSNNGNNGHILLEHAFFTSPFSGSQRLNGVNMYSGTKGTAWGLVWNSNFVETANTGTFKNNAGPHRITRIVGIDRK